MPKIIFSGFADEYSRNVEEQIEILRELGFEYSEPRFVGEKNVADLSDEEAEALKKAFDKSGIKVWSVGSPLGKISLDDDFAPHLEKAERVFKIANVLGAKRIRIFSFYLPEGKSREECREQVVERLGAMLDLADKYGVILCHENEAKIYGESPDYCLDLLENFGGRLKCVFDMGNFVLDGCSPYPYAYGLLKEYIEYFHIKDSLPEKAIVPPGCGKACIKEILEEHLKRGRDFVITLEPHLETFSGLNSLTDSHFSNPYKYENEKTAFLDAAKRIKEIVSELNSKILGA